MYQTRRLRDPMQYNLGESRDGNGAIRFIPCYAAPVGEGQASYTPKAWYSFDQGDGNTALVEWRRKPQSTSRRRWNNFEHYKLEVASSEDVPPQSCSYGYDSPGLGTITFKLNTPKVDLGYDGWFGSVGEPLNGLLPFDQTSEEFPGERELISPLWLSDAVRNSLRATLPNLKKEVSLVNSVIELKDFLSLKESIHRILEAVKLLKKFKGLARTSTIRELLGAASDGFLQWEFNFAPLFSDIAGIYHAINDSTKRIDAKMSQAGKPLVRHFTTEYEEFADSEEESPELSRLCWLNPDNVWGTPIRSEATKSSRYVHYEPTRFHAQVLYVYRYDELQQLFAHQFARLDSLGINLNASIIWNAIPWSFVIDWVVGVSRFLNDHRIDLMEPEIRILRYSYSVRRRRYIHLKSFNRCTYPTAGEGRVTALPVVTETSYQRICELPTASLLQTSGISPKEFILGAALVLSRRKRTRRRVVKWDSKSPDRRVVKPKQSKHAK